MKIGLPRHTLMVKGIGIDIIEIERIKKAVAKSGDKFLKKVFTDHELTYCNKKSKLKVPELAARFAAKEAYMKALGTGLRGIHFKEIEIRNDKAGQPYLKVRGKFLPKVHLSLSHSLDFAVAAVVIE